MARLPDGLILLSGGVNVVRNRDVHFPFRQTSNFLWLTGVEEAGCWMVLDPARGRDTLFVPRVDAHFRVWEGEVPGPAQSRRLFGVGSVRYVDELKSELPKALRGYRRIYADERGVREQADALKGHEVATADLEDALEELRAVKDSMEIALLEEANRISGIAHRAAMAGVRADRFEYEVQARFDSECLRHGLRHQGYPSIVAAGRNAAVLHYRRNASALRRGDLLLIDAGGELKGYTADISRTLPISGRFSGRGRDVYAIVLEVQKSCIARARPGILSAELHLHSMRLIAQGLKDLRILHGDTENLVLSGAVRLFYPHGIGHMLGLDVHDGTGGKKRVLPNPTGVPVRFVARLEPGFVITVEPGLYFNEALLSDPENRRKHRGQVNFERAESFLPIGGVRIEDDILIREAGALNLTDVPKEIDDVEAACRG